MLRKHGQRIIKLTIIMEFLKKGCSLRSYLLESFESFSMAGVQGRTHVWQGCAIGFAMTKPSFTWKLLCQAKSSCVGEMQQIKWKAVKRVAKTKRIGRDIRDRYVYISLIRV